MKKDYSIEIIESPETLADYDFNELKLNALICTVEHEILSIRLKRLVLKNSKVPSNNESTKTCVPDKSVSATLWSRIVGFFKRNKEN